MAAQDPNVILKLPQSELEKIPSAAPPPGVEPNFVNPYSKGGRAVTACSVFLALALILWGSRIYTKARILRKLGLDDLFCTLGLIGAIVLYAALAWGSLKGPYGTHTWDVSLAKEFQKSQMLSGYLEVVFYGPMQCCLKLAFFFFYLQIFWPFRWMRICVYVGITTVILFYVAFEIPVFLLATPRHGLTWVEHLLTPDERNLQHVEIPLASFGLATDVYLLVLPIRAVLQLQLPLRRKLGVLLLFLIGSVACVCSFLSVYFRVVQIRSNDIWFTISDVFAMQTLEALIGVSCMSMTLFAKMLAHHLPPWQKLNFTARGSKASKERLPSTVHLSDYHVKDYGPRSFTASKGVNQIVDDASLSDTGHHFV